MDLALWGLIASSGWAAGINLYLVAALMGGAGRLGLLEVPDALMRTDVLVAAVVLFLVEFVVDKIPLLDSLWDVAHTVIRPLGAILVGYALTGESTGWEQTVGALSSGGLAMSSHLAKATTRAAINTSPEPVSNLLASLLEDGLVFAVVAIAVANPVLALIVVVILLVAGTVLAIALLRVARRGIARIRAKRGGSRTVTTRPEPPPTQP